MRRRLVNCVAGERGHEKAGARVIGRGDKTGVKISNEDTEFDARATAAGTKGQIVQKNALGAILASRDESLLNLRYTKK